VSSRRRILRQANASPEAQRQAQRLRKLRERLVQERAALARWMKRLRRAFNAAEKRQRTIARIEKEMTKREDTP
jgi:hypothetical protein